MGIGLKVCAFPVLATAMLLATWPLTEPAGALSDGGVDIQLVTATDELVVFEARFGFPQVTPQTVDGREYVQVSLHGCDHVTRAGEPDLPITYVELAVPPGTIATASLLEDDRRALAAARPLPMPELLGRRGELGTDGLEQGPDIVDETYVEDPAVYGSLTPYPEALARADAPSPWRHLQVAQVAVYPVSYEPESGQLIWHPRLRVQVRFVPTERAAREAAALVPYLRDEPAWEPLFERRILNYERGKSYKRGPRAAAGGGNGRSMLLQDEADWSVEIGVDTTDVYAVTYEQLEDAGAAVSGVAWSDLGMEVRDYGERVNNQGQSEGWRETYPIAFLPEDDGDGIFEPGESFIFYGQDAWDFFDLPPAERRYLRRNVYWLVAGAGGGAQMDSLPGWLGVEGLSPVRDFVNTIHFEQNIYYMGTTAMGEGSEGPEAFRIDHYNATHPLATAGGGNKFQMYTARMPKVDQALGLQVQLQGQEIVTGAIQHRPRLYLSRSPAREDTTTMTWPFPGNPYKIPFKSDSLVTLSEAELTQAAAAGASVTTGGNYVKIYLPSPEEVGLNASGEGIGIDWIEITYRGLFWLQYNRLLAPLTGLTGVQQLKVERIPDAATAPGEFVALDLTEPRAPRVFGLADSLYSAAGSNRYNLNLQVDLGAEPSSRVFFFVERDKIAAVAGERIAVRGQEVLPSFTGEDYVAIYPRRFGAALEPLLALRESQGHRVYRAPVEDVFAQYSGGRQHVYALKYLLREMWHDGVNPPPDWLLLVGDASVDFAGYALGRATDNSDTNYVPVMTVPGHFPANEGYQIVSSDHWFADNLLGRWTDRMSYNEDMFVGRLTPATTGEVQVLVQKILEYESQDPSESWRHHILMHTDDAFSSRTSGPYIRTTDAGAFEGVTGNGIAYILADSAFDHWVVDSLYHSAMMDSVVSLKRCEVDTLTGRCRRDGQGNVVLIPYGGEADLLANRMFGQTHVRAALERLLNRGTLVWAYQGHSNRSQLAHEEVYFHSYENRWVYDLTNIGRLFLYMGYGCHLAEYAHFAEGTLRRLDAMAEVMMLCCPGELKGAIGVFASSDYEWINHKIEQHVFRVMFQDVPKDDLGRSRWRAGELFSLSKTYLSARDEQRITYTYLGDPALRLGIEPPAMLITLNGTAWDPASMTELISAREDDSLAVRVRLHDQSQVTAPRIMDYVNGEYREVPQELITVVPDTTTDRKLAVAYATQLQRRPYDLTFTAIDYDGSERSVALHVPLTLGIYEMPAGGGLVPIVNGAIVASTSAFRVTLRTGVHLEPGDIGLHLAGEPLELQNHTVTQGTDGAFAWLLDYAPAVPLAETQALAVVVKQRDGQDLALASYDIQFGDVPLSIRQAEWIPSPFADETTLVYELTAPAGRARLRVYTASGRRIIDREELPVAKGLHGIPWDGRDDDGDAIANGLYFYELTVWDGSGRKAGSVLEKVVRVR